MMQGAFRPPVPAGWKLRSSLLLVVWLIFLSSSWSEPGLEYFCLALVSSGCALLKPRISAATLILLAPWLESLAALVHQGSPLQTAGLSYFWIDPLFWGVLAGGLLSSKSRQTEWLPTAAGRFLVLVILVSLFFSQLALLLEWGSGLQSYLQSIWEAMPLPLPNAPEHGFRGALVMLGLCFWPFLAGRFSKLSHSWWWAWLASAAISCVLGLFTWVFQLGPQWPLVQSSFEDPNSYACYLLLSLSVAAAMWSRKTSRTEGWLLLGSGLLIFFVLMLTGSRTALLSLLTAILVWMARYRAAHLLKIVAVLLVVAIALGLGVLDFFPETEVSPSYLLSRSVDSIRNVVDIRGIYQRFLITRLNLWEAAFKMAQERPLSGFGPGLFYQNVSNYYPPGQAGWRPEGENAHNYYLQVASELGWPGLLAFLWFIFNWTGHGSQSWKSPEVFQTILLAGALAYFIMLLSGHPLVLVRQVVLLGGFLGWMGDGVEPPRRREEPFSPTLLVTGCFLLAGLLLQLVLWPPRQICPQFLSKGRQSGIDFVLGFHPTEEDGEHSWRWMKSQGIVCVCGPGSDRNSRVRLSFQASSYSRSRQLTIRLPGDWEWQQSIGPASSQLLTPLIPTNETRSCLLLEVTPDAEPARAVPGTTDQRLLGVRLESVELVAIPQRDQ